MKQVKEKEYEEFQQYLYNKAHGYIWTPDTLELICGGNDNEPERIGKQVLEMLGRVRNERISHMTNDKYKKYVIRSLHKGETNLLKDFLYEAIFIAKGAEPPARDIIEKLELRVYTDDYGHVDDETPSFAISLYKEYRGQGIGSQLMVKMLELLKWQGYERASLAVQKANYAVKMYKKVGFKTVEENAEEYIMVCEL